MSDIKEMELSVNKKERERAAHRYLVSKGLEVSREEVWHVMDVIDSCVSEEQLEYVYVWAFSIMRDRSPHWNAVSYFYCKKLNDTRRKLSEAVV